jgi:hypothetical protein
MGRPYPRRAPRMGREKRPAFSAPGAKRQDCGRLLLGAHVLILGFFGAAMGALRRRDSVPSLDSCLG